MYNNNHINHFCTEYESLILPKKKVSKYFSIAHTALRKVTKRGEVLVEIKGDTFQIRSHVMNYNTPVGAAQRKILDKLI